MAAAPQKLDAFTYRPHPHLCEINTWPWLEELSARHGRKIALGNVPDQEWDRLEALGFDFVWLMGVWQRSPISRRMFRTNPANYAEFDKALPGWRLSQVVGSPYAVQQYAPDPRIGTWRELDEARQKLRARGMGLILDFVTNHTALDHPWVESHPEYFLQGTELDFRRDPSAFYLVERTENEPLFIARARDPYFPPWADVAQLNYFSPAVREAMIGELRTIAAHCDGVRCDMAMLVLNEVFARTWGGLLRAAAPPHEEFWPAAVAALPGFVWIAEVYWDLEWRMQQLGFQFTYDKRLYDRLRSAPAREVLLHLHADWEYQLKSVRFLENHDEDCCTTVFRKQRLPALVTLISTLPGMRFYYQRQLEGRTVRLPISLSVAGAQPPDPAILALYEKILRLSNEEAFHTGKWRLLEVKPDKDSSFENLIAYEWRLGKAWKVVVVNLSDAAAQGWVNLVGKASSTSAYTFADQLNDASYPRQGKEVARRGLYVRLEGYRAHLFDVAAR